MGQRNEWPVLEPAYVLSSLVTGKPNPPTAIRTAGTDGGLQLWTMGYGLVMYALGGVSCCKLGRG